MINNIKIKKKYWDNFYQKKNLFLKTQIFQNFVPNF